MSNRVVTTQSDMEIAAARPQLLRLAGGAALIGLFVFGLSLAVWHGTRFVDHTLTALAVPFPLDGLEGTLLHEAWLLRAGEALYQPLQSDRFVSSPYPPLEYVALAVFAPQQWSNFHVFFAGRLVSLVAMLLATLFLALTVLRLSRSLPAAALAMGLWLAFPPVQLWATRIKPDPLALAFTTAGLLAFTFCRPQTTDHRPQTTDHRPTIRNPIAEDHASGIRHHEGIRHQASRRHQASGIKYQVSSIIALICFVAAYFTKQTAIAAPIAVTLALLIEGERVAVAETRSWYKILMHRATWAALGFGALYGALIEGIGLLLNRLTAGQYTFHIWGLHRSDWWSFELMRKFLELLQPSWPLALLGAVGLIYTISQLVRGSNVVGPALLPACYLLVAPLTLFGSGEIGANHNHLLETQLALTLMGCMFVGSRQSAVGRSIRQYSIVLLALGMLVLQLWGFRERPPWYGDEFAPLEDTPVRYIDFIRHQPGEVLADDVGLLVAAGRTLRYDDPSTMGPAVGSGVWDERTLLAEVAAQHFNAIMLPLGPDATSDSKGRWSPAFIATLHEHYQALYRDSITTYVPKQKQ